MSKFYNILTKKQHEVFFKSKQKVSFYNHIFAIPHKQPFYMIIPFFNCFMLIKKRFFMPAVIVFFISFFPTLLNNFFALKPTNFYYFIYLSFQFLAYSLTSTIIYKVLINKGYSIQGVSIASNENEAISNFYKKLNN